MSADIDEVMEKLLAGHSRVEPTPEAVQRWRERRDDALPRRWTILRPEGGLVPAWAVLAVVLLLVLGLAWSMAWKRMRARSTQATLATERTVIGPLKNAPPLTEEQKKLIQLLATDPSALATKQPGDLEKPATKKPATTPHP